MKCTEKTLEKLAIQVEIWCTLYEENRLSELEIAHEIAEFFTTEGY